MNAMQLLFKAVEDVELENACMQFVAHQSVRNAGVLLLVLAAHKEANKVDDESYKEWTKEAVAYLQPLLKM